MKTVCVYCGSSPGNTPVYAETARAVGRSLAQAGLTLIYGGGARGTMGHLADGALDAGGTVIGVIPEALYNAEVAHQGLTRLDVVPDMHTRKARMLTEADAVVALPGGLGTLEELFEAFTWHQLGFTDKACGLLNVDGYYDGLLQFLGEAVTRGFLLEAHLAYLQVAADFGELLDQLRAYERVHVQKW